MAHKRPPSFFKILLDASAPHLPLPPDFVTRHLQNKIPKNPIIRSAIGGYSWRLKIKKIGESYCFSDGWCSVVTDIQLGFGDFLVFRFDGKSEFKMLVYSPNGCEKDFPPKIDHDSGDVDDDDDDDDDEVVEDADDEDVVVEDVVEVEEDEIEDEDDEEDELEYEEEEEDDEEDEDDDGGAFIDGDDGDPCFTCIISQTHKSVLRLPVEFTELAGINGEGALMLKNLEGKEWETMVEKWNQSEKYCVSSGWDVFRRSNDLGDGDECIFKFISSEDKLLLARVTKKRRPVKQLQTSGEAPATVKKKSGLLEEYSGEAPATVKKKSGLLEEYSGEAPATVKESGLPEGDSDEAPVSGDVKKREGGLKEVVKREIELPEGDSGEVPVVEKRKRGRPARGGGGEAVGEAPVSEVVKRRVQPKRNSGEDPAVGGGKMTRGRAARERGGGVKSSGKTPGSESAKRGQAARGGGVKSSGKSPASEAVKRNKRKQLRRNSGETPAMKVEKRKRGRAAREDGGGGVGSSGKTPASEAVKRSRGRPPKQ